MCLQCLSWSKNQLQNYLRFIKFNNVCINHSAKQNWNRNFINYYDKNIEVSKDYGLES